MKPIYTPKGKAKEYGDYAINIYTGCPHRCYYCYAPSVLRMSREEFHRHVEPRAGIVEAVKAQIEREKIAGKLIHLCFTCDPYPTGYDSTATREIIKIIKESGNHVQLLTKSACVRDYDLLDGGDWVGQTFDGGGGGYMYSPEVRMAALKIAHSLGIKTWISFEPVLDAKNVLEAIEKTAGFVDKIRIGKLNYHPSAIDWGAFGREAEALCRRLGVDYAIKESLREEMDK